MKQSEAMRLANELDAYHTAPHHKQAAAELRRLSGALAAQPAPVQDVSLIDEGKTAAPVQEPVADGLIRGYINALVANKHDEAADATKRMVDYVFATPPAAQRTWVGLDWLPEHKCGLHLSHNEHRDVYETVEQFYESDDFISEEEWHKAVAENSVWVLHWYPNTPIGFTRIAASTLEAIEAKLKENT